MKALNQTLGFYTPAFFKIHIETVNPIDPKQLSEKEQATFIKHEKIYLLVILGVTCIIAIILGVQYKCHIIENAFALSPTVFSYCFAWVGGMIGGISFATKWLYRTVARGYWHEERRL